MKLRYIVLVAALALGVGSSASARSHHHHRHHHRAYHHEVSHTQEVEGSRPAGCPSAWCGCFLARYLHMANERVLWLAASWFRVGSALSAPEAGAIAVRNHHVGLVRDVRPGQILLLSGNDGHRVRERWVSSGSYRYRRI